ncbi:hypothetical protein HDU83_007868 [Entophlyctis luteolus]|nr:hypothetical protein HDU83_007868 [Entophlyctis luteolus]
MKILAVFTFLSSALAATTSTKTKTTTTAAASSCTFTSYPQLSSYKSCSSILVKGPFTVPAESVIDWSNLRAGAVVTVSGTITFAHSTSLTKSDYLWSIGGAGIQFLSDPTNPAILDGNGAAYWDGLGGNGGVGKPKMLSIKTTSNSLLKGIKVLNSPVHCFIVKASDTTIDSFIMDNSAGDKPMSSGITYGHNTDAFDVSGTNINIKNSWVHNQDDCLAIKTATGVNFFNNTCIGGHGISIGSIGSGDNVSNVHVKNCTVQDSLNGMRIKTDAGSSGAAVSGIIYENIILKNIYKATNSDDPPAMGICIRQDYKNGGPTNVPSGTITISNVTATNFQGTVTSNSFGNAYSTFILCTPGMCSDFQFSNINITPKFSNCTNISPTPIGC